MENNVDQRLGAGGQRTPGGKSVFQVIGPDGRKYEVMGDNPEGAVQAVHKMLSGSPSSDWRDAPIVEGAWRNAPIVSDSAEDQALRASLLAAGQKEKQKRLLQKQGQLQPKVSEKPEADMSFWGRVKDNVIGVDDGVASYGEKAAALLNKAGESMTMGVVGDEAAGAVDAALGRGGYAERRDFYRQQEADIEASNPKLALAADVAGALLGPGKGAGAFISKGTTTASRVGRGALTGAGAGVVSGATEGENATERFNDGLVGAAIGVGSGGVLTGVGQGFLKAAEVMKRNPQASKLVPTVEGLQATARDLFAKAEASGARMPKGRVVALSRGAERKLNDQGYHPRLHPRIGVVLDELKDMGDGPQSLQRLEQARRIAGNAAQSLQPDERRLASVIIDEIDTAVNKMGAGSSKLREARDVWGRMRRLETIEGIIEDASNSKNFEQSLKTKFAAMLRNPKKLRGFNPKERALMKRIAQGSMVEKALAALGRQLSPNSLSGIALTGGAAYSTGIGAAAIPAIGMGARAGANAMTRSNAQALRNLTAMDETQRALAMQAAQRTNHLAPLSVLPGVPYGEASPRNMLEP